MTTSIAQALLKVSYYYETFFSRLQVIGFDAPKWNGEYRLIRTLRRLVKVAIDGRANRGNWTATLMSTSLTLEHVICVEPDERNCQQIRDRFTDRRVSVVNAALVRKSEPSASPAVQTPVAAADSSLRRTPHQCVN